MREPGLFLFNTSLFIKLLIYSNYEVYIVLYVFKKRLNSYEN